MPDIVLSTLPILTHLILTTTFKETETERMQVTCSGRAPVYTADAQLRVLVG